MRWRGRRGRKKRREKGRKEGKKKQRRDINALTLFKWTMKSLFGWVTVFYSRSPNNRLHVFKKGILCYQNMQENMMKLKVIVESFLKRCSCGLAVHSDQLSVSALSTAGGGVTRLLWLILLWLQSLLWIRGPRLMKWVTKLELSAFFRTFCSFILSVPSRLEIIPWY